MPAEPDPALLATDLRETLGRLVRRVRAEPGPPIGRMAVLLRLERDGPASVSDLAAAERMRPQSMAQAVGDLEGARFVSRRPDPGDRRRAIVELTAAGEATLRETRETRDSWLAGVLSRDLDARERARLRDALGLLNRIADA